MQISYISEIEYCHLHKIESGKINTSTNTLIKIADALEVPIIMFFTNINCLKIIDNTMFSEIHSYL